MQPNGTDTLLSLLQLAVGAMERQTQAVTRLEMAIAHLSAECLARHAELMAKPGAAAPEPSAPTSMLNPENLAKLATNLTTIGAALAKVWGPALVVAATFWRVVWPWLRSHLGLG